MITKGLFFCDKCRRQILTNYLERKVNKRKLQFCTHQCFYDFHKKTAMTLTQKHDFEEYEKKFKQLRMSDRVGKVKSWFGIGKKKA